MGIIRAPLNARIREQEEEQNTDEEASCAEEELLPRRTGGHGLLVTPGMPPILSLCRFFGKHPGHLCNAVLAAAGLIALVPCAMLAANNMRHELSPQQPLLPQHSPPPPAPLSNPQTSMPMQPVPESTPTPQRQTCNYEKSDYCPAHYLFESPDVHDTVTDSLMRTGSTFIEHTDYTMVQEFVRIGLKRIGQELQQRVPVVAEELDRAQLKVDEWNAVLKMISLIGNYEVQQLGYQVTKALRAGASPTRSKESFKWYIEDFLDERLDEMQKLAIQLIPSPVRDLWGAGGHDWEMTLDPENVHIMQTINVKPISNFTYVDLQTKSFSIYAGVLEEGRVLLDLMKICIRAVGPSWDTSTRRTIDILFESIAQPAKSGDLELMEAFLWPLRCGAQGIDALRASCSSTYGKARSAKMHEAHEFI